MAKDIDKKDNDQNDQCISACEKSHGGPFTALEKLNDLVQK